MGGSVERTGQAASPGLAGEHREPGPVTRRSLLAWLGRASVLGLFSPLIDACVQAGRDPARDLAGLRDLPFLDPGEAGEDAPPGDEDALATDADAAPDLPDASCPPPPGPEDLPVFEKWGERTVDPQDLASLLASWRLTINGLVRTPLTLDFCQLRDLGLVGQVTDFHCVEGWSILDVPWDGIPLARLLDLAGVRPEAGFLKIHSVGGRYTESLPLPVAREPRTLLALGIGGSTLSLKHGFPARIVVPRLLAYKSPKYVTRIELTDTEHVGFWPRFGYPVSGEVPPERLREGKY